MKYLCIHTIQNSVAFMLYIYFKSPNNAIIPPIYLSLLSSTEFFPSTILVLLWVLVRVTSCLFTVLKRRMKEMLLKNSAIELNELRTWKFHHGLIIDLIKRINRCFGLVSLVMMVHTFITFIYNVYQFIGCLKDFSISPYFYIYKFILQAVLPCYLIYSCSQLKEKVWFPYRDIQNCWLLYFLYSL